MAAEDEIADGADLELFEPKQVASQEQQGAHLHPATRSNYAAPVGHANQPLETSLENGMLRQDKGSRELMKLM